MRRPLIALLVTVVVTVMLVNFRVRPVLSAGSTPIPATAPTPRPAHLQPASTRHRPVRVRTVVGPAVATQYGPVQVAATLAGHHVRSARALVLPSGNPTSDAISAQVGPLLGQEVTAAQSARINTISGASYTSDGYRRSLQAALDRAHV